MSVRLRSVAFTCDDPGAVATFWAALLGRPAVDDAAGVLLAGDDTQLGLRFAPGHVPPGELHRIHLHLTSETREHQRATVSAALSLNARHLDVGQRPAEVHVVLADPAGHAFCVIEPGNGYLADTGFLGEIACDGSRAVGLFWSAALDWPLVWDQDEETAVQSPRGGTKVAWGGAPVRPAKPVEPQYFELVVVDGALTAEVDRLVALGASIRNGSRDDVAVMADPDGVTFLIQAR